MKSKLLSIAIAEALLGLAAGAASAATLTVTTTASGTDAGDGACSLAEAIDNANADAATHADCAAGSGADTISLPAGQTITLSQRLPDIASNVTIAGNDATIARDETVSCVTGTEDAGRFGLLRVDGSTVTIDSATFSGGCESVNPSSGTFNSLGAGGILAAGGAALTVRDSVFRNNRSILNAGAIAADGASLLVEDCVFEDNVQQTGGAIGGFDGSINIKRSTFRDNVSYVKAGAIYSKVNLTISDSTFSGNTSTGGPDAVGAIYLKAGKNATITGSSFYGNRGRAGVVSVSNNPDSSTVTIARSTLSGNSGSVAGALYTGAYFGGGFVISDSTLIDNAGPAQIRMHIYGAYSRTLSLERSILAGTTGCTITGPVAGSGSDNLLHDTSCPGVGGTTTTTTALALGPIQDNGGPTPTRAPAAGSVAIDAAGSACAATDQRGVARPADGDGNGSVLCDTGAFEVALQPGPDFLVNEIGDVGDGACEDSALGCTLREAVLAANANVDASIISFDPGVFGAGATVTLTSDELRVTETLTLAGSGETIERDAALGCITSGSDDAGEFRLINAYATVLTASSLTLTNGCADGAGNAGKGGGIYAEDTELHLSDVTLTGNSAIEGGGLKIGYSYYTNTLSNVTASGNYGGYGGGMSIDAAATLSGITLSGNSTGYQGGGLLVRSSGDVTLTQSALVANQSVRYGGGVHVSGQLSASNVTLSDNSADSDGEAIMVTASGAVNLTDSTVYDSGAYSSAHVIFALLPSASVNASRNALVSASAGLCGGAVAADASNRATASCDAAIIESVAAMNLGALADNGGATLTHLPGPGSVLVDAVSGCGTTDQRGETRPVDADGIASVGCDIGAVEVQNLPVIAVADSVATDQNTDLAGNLLDNDSDSATDEDQALAITAVDGSAGNVGATLTPAAGGQLTVNADGSYSLAVGSDFVALGGSESAAISVTYTVEDGHASSTGTATLTVNGLNDLPSAGAISDTFDEDTARTLAFVGSDPDTNDTLSYTIDAAPLLGTVVNHGDGTFTFTPGSDFADLGNGDMRSVTFNYTVSDGTATDGASVTLTITGVNDAPVTPAASYALDADATITRTLGATDADGDPLIYSVTDAPTFGRVELSGDSFTFFTDGEFDDLAGGEQRVVDFEYEVSDGSATNRARVTLTVNGLNSAPTATDMAASIGESQSATLAFAGADSDTSDTLSYTIDLQPTAGVASNVVNDTLVFNTNGEFESLDDGETVMVSIPWTVMDNAGATDSASAIITISGENDRPTAAASAVGTTKSAPVTAAFAGSDVDAGDTLSYTITSAPTSGLLTNNGDGTFTFDPNGQFDDLGDSQTREVSFSWTAFDGDLTSTSATVTVTVAGANTAPVANAASIEVGEDAPLSAAFPVSDLEGDDLTFSIDAQPAAGAVTTDDATDTFTFDPAGAFEALDDGDTQIVSFDYTVSDGIASASASVQVTVNGANDAPISQSLAIGTTKSAPVSGAFVAGDADAGDVLGYQITAQPADGTVTNNGNGTFTFDPAGQFNDLGDGDTRVVTFSYVANDGDVDSNTAVVTVTVAGSNTAPVAVDSTVSADEDTSVTAAFNATDADGNDMSFTIDSAPVQGTVTVDNVLDQFTFVPAGAFESLDDGDTQLVSFDYTVSDGIATDSALVQVTVNGVNDAPVATSRSLSTTKDATISAGFLGSDVDTGDVLTFRITTQPADGTVTNNGDGTFSFDPAGEFSDLGDADSRKVTFGYVANDGDTDGNTAVVNIIVTGSNTAPVAADSMVSTSEDAPVTAPFSATDAQNDPLTFAIETAPAKGVLTVDNDTGTFTYDPDDQFETLGDGQAQQIAFIYTVNDGVLDDLGTVTLTIDGVNDAPVAANDSAVTQANQTLTVAAANGLLANDSDIEGDALSVVAGTFTPAGIGGALTLNADGSFEYTPPADTEGVASYEYTVSDGEATDTALLTIAVSTPTTADLQIDKTDGVEIITPDHVFDYQISVFNAGPADAIGAAVQDLLPAELANVSWSCEAIGAAACGSASGTGDIQELVDIPSGDAVIFGLTATVTGATMPVVNTATVAAPVDLVDEDQSNNSATDTDLPVLVFRDGFESPAVRTQSFAVRHATLAAESLVVPADGPPTLVLRAQDSGQAELALALVHARRMAGRVELRINRLEHEQWVVGEWQAVSGADIELRW